MFGDASVVSWSKDSIFVSWRFSGADHPRNNQTELRGYKIRATNHSSYHSILVVNSQVSDSSLNLMFYNL